MAATSAACRCIASATPMHPPVLWPRIAPSDAALTSLLYYTGARRAALLTHLLVEMVEESTATVPEARAVLEDARMLDLHYIPSRYPNGLMTGILVCHSL